MSPLTGVPRGAMDDRLREYDLVRLLRHHVRSWQRRLPEEDSDVRPGSQWWKEGGRHCEGRAGCAGDFPAPRSLDCPDGPGTAPRSTSCRCRHPGRLAGERINFEVHLQPALAGHQVGAGDLRGRRNRCWRCDRPIDPRDRAHRRPPRCGISARPPLIPPIATRRRAPRSNRRARAARAACRRGPRTPTRPSAAERSRRDGRVWTFRLPAQSRPDRAG